MKTTKRIFTIFLTLFVASSVWAHDFEVDGICYNYVNDGVEVTNGGEYSGDVTLPSSVTYSGKSYSVTSIGEYAFSCRGLTSVTIPNSVTSIGEGAFSFCSGLTSITIPNSVTSIGEGAFIGCDNLTYNEYDNALYLGNSENPYLALIKANGSDITSCLINEETRFIGDKAFADCSGLTSVTIPNSVTSIGEFAFYSCSGLTSVTIHNSVTSIGEGAFEECTGLTSITLPSSVTSIKAGTFAKCTNLTSIICLAEIPPVVISDREGYNCDPSSSWYEECREYAHANPFNTGGRNAVTVYVPSDAVSLYKVALDWRSSPVDIQPIPAENVTISKDEVDVKVEKSSADFYMPMNASADSYTLTIKNNGVTFCTLTFNPQGQLANIDFSTTKSYELKADVSAFKFSVTGLSAATDYKYSFKALASNKSVLKEYSGSFTTKNEDGTGGSVQGGGECTLAVDNVSANNAITISNNQILVNGEAPAFVVTVAGQKIANANLKSGVYFVVVDGEMVKVMK